MSDHLKAQIVSTVGPSSVQPGVFEKMLAAGADIARLNFSYGDHVEKKMQIDVIRDAAAKAGRVVPIIQDLSGPRIQEGKEHGYDSGALEVLTDKDRKNIKFGVAQGIEYIAMSFVGNAGDVEKCRAYIRECGGNQPVIAKIERKMALENLDEIIAAADAIMIARGDLGNEVPLEQIPFVQADIIRKCKAAKKPVITATQMMLSMTEKAVPSRAEVTDVANAILLGSDAVMLSEESASGKFPVEAVDMMHKIIREAEKRMADMYKPNMFVHHNMSAASTGGIIA